MVLLLWVNIALVAPSVLPYMLKIKSQTESKLSHETKQGSAALVNIVPIAPQSVFLYMLKIKAQTEPKLI